MEECGGGGDLEEAEKGDVPPGSKILLLKEQDDHHVGEQIGDRHDLHCTMDLEQFPERSEHSQQDCQVGDPAIEAKYGKNVGDPYGGHGRQHRDDGERRVLFAQGEQNRPQRREGSHVDCEEPLDVHGEDYRWKNSSSLSVVVLTVRTRRFGARWL